MIYVRSLLYHVMATAWTTTLAILLLPALVLPAAVTRAGARLWTGGLVWLARVLCGIRWEVVGSDRLPHGPCILAARHESAWDTYFMLRLLPSAVFVMKRELMNIPLVGAYMRRAGSIVIDRAARVQAMQTLIAGAKAALADNVSIIVFPEGTRVAPDKTAPYHAGVGALYTRCNVPVVPLALNSGHLWPRRGFLRRPGTILVEVLEPIPPGLDRRTFVATLRERIEKARSRLT